MNTELEKKLFRWLYKSLITLSKLELKEMNAIREDEGDWPAGQEWNECVGSSHAVFFGKARTRCGIDSDEYLELLRNDPYALQIAEEELEAADKESTNDQT